MSIKNTAVVTCPNCKKDFEVTFWDSLNGDLNPKEKEELLKGNLFRKKCEHCGEVIPVFYPVLYHDMSNQAMVWFVVDKKLINDVYENIKSAKNELNSYENYNEYKFRIVFDHNDLREKALIIDKGLDDRVIEFLKLVFSATAMENYPEEEIKKIYFDTTDNQNEYVFMIYTKSGEILSATFNKDFYNQMASEYSGIINKKSENEYVINREWAIKLFEEK